MWRLERTADGSPTARHAQLGEACHPREGAWTQARERYARACRLHELARAPRAPGAPGPACVRLLDVGTGLGLNLAAALEALEGSQGVALEALTLEQDRAVLAHALALEDSGALEAAPEALRRTHAQVRAALALALQRPGERVPLGGAGSLELRLGDARAELAGPGARRFDAIFLDPFSPRVAPELWEAGFLARLARALAPGGWLSTYSAATEVRARLAAAGLAVGAGPRVGAKREGTLASPDLRPPALAPRVARRIARRAAVLREGAASAPSGEAPRDFPLAPCGEAPART